MTEFRFYRSATHPDMLFEIRLVLEEHGLDIRLTEIVAGLMDAYVWDIPQAIRCVKTAVLAP